jgi:hypothetical protein
VVQSEVEMLATERAYSGTRAQDQWFQDLSAAAGPCETRSIDKAFFDGEGVLRGNGTIRDHVKVLSLEHLLDSIGSRQLHT